MATVKECSTPRSREQLIAIAHKYAIRIASTKGTVCAPQVLTVMREKGLLEDSPHDPRWIGAVFGERKGWRRTGRYRRIGSHKRDVTEWALAEAA